MRVERRLDETWVSDDMYLMSLTKGTKVNLNRLPLVSGLFTPLLSCLPVPLMGGRGGTTPPGVEEVVVRGVSREYGPRPIDEEENGKIRQCRSGRRTGPLSVLAYLRGM